MTQNESWLWRERGRLQEDKAEFQQHRENLERERDVVIEAAKKLDREASDSTIMDKWTLI